MLAGPLLLWESTFRLPLTEKELLLLLVVSVHVVLHGLTGLQHLDKIEHVLLEARIAHIV